MSLAQKSCTPCRGGEQALSLADAKAKLKDIPGWEISADGKWLSRRFKFKNFMEALDFVNRAAPIAEKENHHPDIEFGWGYVTLKLQTHAIGGLHNNDFILAAKFNQLLK